MLRSKLTDGGAETSWSGTLLQVVTHFGQLEYDSDRGDTVVALFYFLNILFLKHLNKATVALNVSFFSLCSLCAIIKRTK